MWLLARDKPHNVWGNPLIKSYFIFNNSAERNSTIKLIHISSSKPQISSISISGFIIKLGQTISHKPTVGLTSFHHQKLWLFEEVQMNLQFSSKEEIFQATQVNLYFCSYSFSFSSFRLHMCERERPILVQQRRDSYLRSRERERCDEMSESK